MIKKILSIDILLFIVLAFFAYFNNYFPLDLTITQTLQKIQLGWFDSAMRILSFWGEASRSLTAVLLVSFVFYLLKLRKDAVLIALSSYGLVLLTTIIKFLVHRTRPSGSLVEQLIPQLNSESFPSYHVIVTIAIFGYLFFILHKHIKNNPKRRFLETICLSVIFLMGLSRVYLGAHWASDVVGSFLLGFGWVGLVCYNSQHK